MKPRVVVSVASLVALACALLVGSQYVGDWVALWLSPHLTPSTEPAVHRAIMAATLLYVLLMALPFVPGVEIGLGMMLMFGAPIVPLVYGSTVLALCLSFLIGRLVPQTVIIGVCDHLRLTRTARLLREVEHLDAGDRPAFLLRAAPGRLLPLLLRHRCLALVFALNVPGNAVVGGGGGIGLVAGYSRVFTFPAYASAVAIGILPAPLLVLLAQG